MTDDQLYDFLIEKFAHVGQAQAATASTVRSLVSALRESERNRQSDDSRLALLEQALARFDKTSANVESALIQLIGHVSPRDLSKISAEDLVNNVPIETIRRARDIHWARSKGESDPLPSVPSNIPRLIEQETTSGHVEIVPVHIHRRKDDDNSVAIKTGKDGKTRLKTNIEVKKLGGWIVAFLVFAVLTWREVQRAYNEPRPVQEQRQIQVPSLPVPQLSPPSVPMPNPGARP